MTCFLVFTRKVSLYTPKFSDYNTAINYPTTATQRNFCVATGLLRVLFFKLLFIVTTSNDATYVGHEITAVQRHRMTSVSRQSVTFSIIQVKIGSVPIYDLIAMKIHYRHNLSFTEHFLEIFF